MKGVFAKQDGEWYLVDAPMVNVGGSWAVCKSVHVRTDLGWSIVWKRSAEIIKFPSSNEGYKGLQDVRTCTA